MRKKIVQNVVQAVQRKTANKQRDSGIYVCLAVITSKANPADKD